MHVNPHRRAASARLLLDALSSFDIDNYGTEEADLPTLLALKPLGLDLEQNEKTAAAVSGALDLLWFITAKMAQEAGVTQEELISNLRQYVLPGMYPDVYGSD